MSGPQNIRLGRHVLRVPGVAVAEAESENHLFLGNKAYKISVNLLTRDVCTHVDDTAVKLGILNLLCGLSFMRLNHNHRVSDQVSAVWHIRRRVDAFLRPNALLTSASRLDDSQSPTIVSSNIRSDAPCAAFLAGRALDTVVKSW